MRRPSFRPQGPNRGGGGSGQNCSDECPERDCGDGGRKASAGGAAIQICSRRQNDLQNIQKQMDDIQRKLSEGARTLSQDEQAKLQRDGELLSHKLQRGTDDLNEELQAAQGEIVDTIGRKMLEVLDRYSRENGYTVVLDTSAQGSPVVYGSSQSDITQEIVKLYDQAYPAKAGAPAAAAPSTPKPSSPAPAPAKKPTQ